ncbi:MAG: hypothetical protein WCB51_01705 [Candidatus Dormiibacterota bacterium]
MRILTSRLALLIALSVLGPIAMTLTACGSGVAQLSVTLTSDWGKGPFTPGTTPPNFQLVVTNLGPGNASGVVVHAVMPPTFQFAETNSITSNGAARTTPQDAHAGGSNPEWGVWSLSSPTSPNGKTDYASVTIDFAVTITALPNTYSLQAQVVDDNLASTVESQPLQVEVNQAPRLAVSASVSPTSVHPGGTVTYRVTVTNTGSGISPDVDVLVTLPPALQFQTTIMPFGGNTAVEQPIFPVKGGVLAFYGGFELPPQTSLGPGKLIIQFIAQCVPNPGKGVFPVHVQVTDFLGDSASIVNVAPLNIFSS